MEDPESKPRPSLQHDTDRLLETSSSTSETDIEVAIAHGRRRTRRGISTWTMIHLCVLLLYSSIFIGVLLEVYASSSYTLLQDMCTDLDGQTTETDLLSTPMQEAMRKEVRTVYADVDETSLYKGPPTASVDKAWRDLFRYSHIRINAADLARMNRTSVQLKDGSGDFLATPDTYHQLHCLWYIFQNVHSESYTVKPTNVPITEHLDHCIDSLRQHIMCHATASLQTYSWIPDLRIPWANFNVDNVCVDWKAYDGWAKNHSIDVYAPRMLIHPDLGLSFPDGEPTETNFRGPA